MYRLAPFKVWVSDLLQVMLSGRPVWCRRLAERGMHPSASLRHGSQAMMASVAV